MTIVFLCPRPETPSGGVWFLHRLAGLLAEAGLPALVWTPKPFEVFWDAHPVAPGLIVSDVQLLPGDTVVVPEVMWPMMHRSGVREILFLQNYVWLDPQVYRQAPGEVLVVSRFLANWSERMLGVKALGKITPFLDDDVWPATPKTTDRVLLLARRNPYHAAMRAALEANGFTVEYITQPVTQREIAEALGRCEFYLHLTHPEGFPMACLEAMRARTIVAGTTGGGGNEFMFHRETAMCVQDPDSGRYFNADEFVRRCLDAMLELRADAELRSRLASAGLEWSRRYTAQATQAELKGIFG